MGSSLVALDTPRRSAMPAWSVSRPHDHDEVAADRLADTADGRAGPGTGPQDFSPAFGFDFRGVRIHSDHEADAFAHELGARAATIGQDIYFARGQYAPHTSAGRRLLLHELAHVTQEDEHSPPRIRRQCQDLIEHPGVNVLGGAAVHTAIQNDFAARVDGAVHVPIPGSSARPQRTDRNPTVIPPQPIGGSAGIGYPDLGRINNRIYTIGEIKPALPTEIHEGEVQLARYIDQGNARDPQQQAWRDSQGVSVVSPLHSGIYEPPQLDYQGVSIRTCWMHPGLLIYGTYVRVNLPPHPVRQRSREEGREPSRQQRPVQQGTPEPATRSMSDKVVYWLVGLGISVTVASILAPAIVAALADPEPLSKLAAIIGLSAATALLIFLGQGGAAHTGASGPEHA
jgi:hypothetical protein